MDGLAPVGAWVAITGHAPLAAWLLGGAVALWIAGFDVIYAALDLDIDRAQGLHSLPADFGLGPALTLPGRPRAAVVLLVAVGSTLGLGPVYYVGVALVAVLLGYENSIVGPDDLSRVDAAFFSVNGAIAVLYLAAVVLDAAIA